MNMKKSFIGILAATIILSGCGTSQMAVGDPNACLLYTSDAADE